MLFRGVLAPVLLDGEVRAGLGVVTPQFGVRCVIIRRALRHVVMTSTTPRMFRSSRGWLLHRRALLDRNPIQSKRLYRQRRRRPGRGARFTTWADDSPFRKSALGPIATYRD